MAQKLHCDICDDTTSVRSSGSEFLSIIVNGLKHEVKLSLTFEPRYAGDDGTRRDLCHGCQQQVFATLCQKFGVTVVLEERRTR